MAVRVNTVAFIGIKTSPVNVQVQIASGMPAFNIVGMPDKAIAESKERIRAAIASLGLSLPPKRITVNLAPADVPKEGSHYDLPIILGILASIDILPIEELENYLALGELALDASISEVTGVLPAAVFALSRNLGLICPQNQGSEAVWAGNNEIIAPKNLLELINHFKGNQILSKPQPKIKSEAYDFLDLAEIKGQESAKRALEIAAAGRHNMLMIGPPGSGKSMLAQRLPSILPQLSPREALEVSIIHSLAGNLKDGSLIRQRPFRAPHHNASSPALVGGGSKARPGEISLAHKGVLFLDELPEFSKQSLEALRQPIETGKVTIARVNNHITYPCDFQLIAAMNPCRCGYLGVKDLECSRAPKCALEYQAKISGPMLDRIDIFVEVPRIEPSELAGVKSGTSSEMIRKRVENAHQIQRDRYKDYIEKGEILYNANISVKILEETLKIKADAENMLINAANKMHLSGRGYHRILKVARTLADLTESDFIEKSHIAEAVSYRRIIPGKGVA